MIILLPKDLEVKEKLPIFAGDTIKHPLQGLLFITIKNILNYEKEIMQKM